MRVSVFEHQRDRAGEGDVRGEVLERRREVADARVVESPVRLAPRQEQRRAGERADRVIAGVPERRLAHAEPRGHGGDGEREHEARAVEIRRDAVHDGQDQEVTMPGVAEEMKLRLDEGDVGADQERAEQQHVIVDDRRARAAPPDERVTRGRGDGHQERQRQRADALEVVLQHQPGRRGEEHRAAPGQDAQLGMKREDLAALARQEGVCGRVAEERTESSELGLVGKHGDSMDGVAESHSPESQRFVARVL